MKIKILGCSGSQTPHTNFISLLLNDYISIDAGNISGSLTYEKQEKIKYILISHSHMDHIKDICFLADNRALYSTHPLTVFASYETIKNLKTHIFNNKIWPDFTKIPSEQHPILHFKPKEFEKPFYVDNYYITLFKVKHIEGSSAFLITTEDKTILYTGDIGYDKEFWKKIKKIKIDAMFVDISFPNRMEKIAIETNHLTPHLFYECIKELNYLPSKIYALHNKLNFADDIKKEIKSLPIKNPEISILKNGEVLYI